MQELREACSISQIYPMNLMGNHSYQYILKEYYERLNVRESALFKDKGAYSVHFWQLSSEKRFQAAKIDTLVSLQEYLWKDIGSDDAKPRCRFMFVTSPHSREKLLLSRAMMCYVFSYQQVFAGFLDLILSFGKSEWAQDFQYSAFRQESTMGDYFKNTAIPELGRSGIEIRLCYGLKSAEASTSVSEWPWSIRSMAIYHSFDVQTGNSEWIVVKGNQRMKTRIISTASSSRIPSATHFSTVEDAFSSNLTFHVLYCDWAAEGWRWYISFLEQKFQTLTRHALAIQMSDRPPNASMHYPSVPKPLKLSSVTSSTTLVDWEWNKKGNCAFTEAAKSPKFSPSTLSQFSGTGDGQVPPSNAAVNRDTHIDHSAFSFTDIQETQHLEEKTNEIAHVLELNISIIEELSNYYSSMKDRGDCTPVIRQHKNAIPHMMRRLDSITKNLQMHLSRTKSLLQLLANRKSLLYAILEYHNVEGNRILAEKTQLSTDSMEKITREMHQIAQKTQQETVSMRIITLVTLFFLPGTFISTIMSTDIVQFANSSDKIVSTGALKLYIAITAPLMIVTFAAWYAVYWLHSEKNEGGSPAAPVWRLRRWSRAGKV